MPTIILTPTIFTSNPAITYGEGADELNWNNLTGDPYVDDFDQPNDYTEYLFMTGLNAALPSGAVPSGFKLSLLRQAVTAGGFPQSTIRDIEVRMIIGGAVAGNNKAKTSSNWPTGNVDGEDLAVYGSSSDLWGNTPTRAQVNDSANFGFAIACRCASWSGENIDANILTGPEGNPEEEDYYPGIQVEITYSVVAPTSTDVGITASIQPATTNANKNVSLFAAINADALEDVALTASIGSGLVLTNPTSGDVVTSAELLVTWDHSPTTQSDYRVRVWDNALEAGNPVYDSGVVGSTLEQHLIPAGSLPTGALWIRVEAHDTNQQTSRSSLVDFTTSFPTSVNVTNVRTEVLGGECAPMDLPGVRVRWNQIVPGGGETFVLYDIRRREPGGQWVTIAQVEAIDTLKYDDMNAEPEIVYEYAVNWRATSGASILVSAEQTTPPIAETVFDFTWLHVVGQPTRQLRLHHWEAVVSLDQDSEVFQPWGRRKPTGYTGEKLAHRVNIPMHPSHRRTNRDTWNAIEDFCEALREGEVLCLRIGRDAERYFVLMKGPSKRVLQKTYEPNLEFFEVDYSEDVNA